MKTKTSDVSRRSVVDGFGVEADDGRPAGDGGTLFLSWPAIAALVAYIILAIVVLVPLDMYTYDARRDAYVKHPYRFAERLLIVLILFFPFFLGVYSVNCMVVGDCLLWSWVVAAITVIWALAVVITAARYQAFRLDDIA